MARKRRRKGGVIPGDPNLQARADKNRAAKEVAVANNKAEASILRNLDMKHGAGGRSGYGLTRGEVSKMNSAGWNLGDVKESRAADRESLGLPRNDNFQDQVLGLGRSDPSAVSQTVRLLDGIRESRLQGITPRAYQEQQMADAKTKADTGLVKSQSQLVRAEAGKTTEEGKDLAGTRDSRNRERDSKSDLNNAQGERIRLGNKSISDGVALGKDVQRIGISPQEARAVQYEQERHAAEVKKVQAETDMMRAEIRKLENPSMEKMARVWQEVITDPNSSDDAREMAMRGLSEASGVPMPAQRVSAMPEAAPQQASNEPGWFATAGKAFGDAAMSAVPGYGIMQSLWNSGEQQPGEAKANQPMSAGIQAANPVESIVASNPQLQELQNRAANGDAEAGAQFKALVARQIMQQGQGRGR